MKTIYQGKHVLVTGADGFIGSHMVEALVKSGAHVRAMVAYNSWSQCGWLSDIEPKILSEVELFFCDVRDADMVKASVHGCEFVFHLASLIAIPFSYLAPRTYVETNILGTLNVLQATRESDCISRVLHTSTSEVYGSAQFVPINEEHPIVGQSPYSASKIGADKIAESFWLSFGLPLVTARPFNTFGPRQTARAVIPTIASQLISGAENIKIGSLSPTRDFNYVTDTVGGMLALGGCQDAEGQVVNIGSGEEWSIEETFNILCEIVGNKPSILQDKERLRPENSEVNRLVADNQKIKKLTGWSSALPFKKGLEKTVSWIEKNIDQFNSELYSR